MRSEAGGEPIRGKARECMNEGRAEGEGAEWESLCVWFLAHKKKAHHFWGLIEACDLVLTCVVT